MVLPRIRNINRNDNGRYSGVMEVPGDRDRIFDDETIIGFAATVPIVAGMAVRITEINTSSRRIARMTIIPKWAEESAEQGRWHWDR